MILNFFYDFISKESKWCVKYQTLKNRLDPGGREDNNEKTLEVDGIVLAAGAWCEYLGGLIDVDIPVCNNFVPKFIDSRCTWKSSFIFQS